MRSRLWLLARRAAPVPRGRFASGARAAEALAKVEAATSPADLAAYTSVLKVYVEDGVLEEVAPLVEALGEKGLMNVAPLTYKRLIFLAYEGDAAVAAKRRCVDEMRRFGLQPSLEAYEALGLAHVAQGDAAAGDAVLKEMQDEGLRPPASLFAALLAHQHAKSAPEEVRRLLGAMLQAGVRPDVASVETLLRTFGDGEAVRTEIEAAAGRVNLYTYNALLDALAQRGDVPGVHGVMEAMAARGVRPSPYSYNALIDACGNAGDLANAGRVLELMANNNVPPIPATFASLARALASGKDFAGARGVVALMEAEPRLAPDTTTFNAILQEHGRQGDAGSLEETLELMGVRGVAGDETSCDAVLAARGKAGDVLGFADAAATLQALEDHRVPVQRAAWHRAFRLADAEEGEGAKAELLQLFGRMQQALGDRPDRVSYAIVLDWLAKRGLEAETEALLGDMLEKSRLRPSASIWRLLDRFPALKEKTEAIVAEKVAAKVAKDKEVERRRSWRRKELAS